MSYAETFLAETCQIARALDVHVIEEMASALAGLRERGGRLFILGVGGSAANASHAVNDFRKLCDIEAYAPTDNVSELTARTNDEGWSTVFEAWLRTSRLSSKDALLVLSVGGGDDARNVSPNLVAAVKLAKAKGALLLGIVGRDGGFTARVADRCLIVPTVNPAHVTPLSEAFQGIVWHLLVSHPRLQRAATRWESLGGGLRSVFLDRDGVLTTALVVDGKPGSARCVEDLCVVPEALSQLQRLKSAGFRLIVVTNQPDLARGNLAHEDASAMNEALRKALPILDDILVCAHDDTDACDCRKPRPGLLHAAAERHGLDLTHSYMIGDRWRDIDAGVNAGCRTVWIDRGYKERAPQMAPGARVSSLAEAVDWVLSDSGRQV